MNRELPSGTVTFLMTDVEGSTRLWGKQQALMGPATERHECLIQEAVTEHGGHVLKSKLEGDSHFCVFSRASDAAAAALAMQRALAQETWPEGIQIRVRVALHSGEAELRNGDYFGPPINRCARIRATAHGGQIVLSDATKRLIGDNLPAGGRFLDLGIHQLKDLEEPERIHQLCGEGLQDAFPPLISMSAAHHNLPVQLTSFVGREALLVKIPELLKRSRLVTLLGAGGSGKTRLSIQVAAEAIEAFKDGVWFVSLVTLSDGKLIPQALAGSLPISLKGRDPMGAILEEYRDLEALFVLDNCEHLARDAAPVVNQMLRECPKLRVLATSREPLAVSGEAVFVVPPMESDLHGEPPTVDRVRELEAVKLFCDRAAMRLSGEEVLKEETAEDIAKLCRRLDGIPLAIEQAASNLSYLSPQQILDRLEKHFGMLAMNEEGVDDRHRTMQATIDWSYSMLSDQERILFERLGVFVGGWTLAAAESVCTDEALASQSVLCLLELLVKRSLVVAENAPWGEKRFRMLVPIREYALGRLRLCRPDALYERHFVWHHHLAQQAHQVGLDPQNGLYFRWLALEHDNVLAALRWGLGRNQFAIKTLELAVAMHRFWWRRGHLREALYWLQHALDNASSASEELRADALNAMGTMMWLGGQLDPAERAFQECAHVYGQLNLEIKWAAAHSNLGGVAFGRHQFRTALNHHETAITIYRKHADLQRLGTSLLNGAFGYQQLADLQSAESYLREALAIFRNLDEPALTARSLDGLIGVYADKGELLQHGEVIQEIAELALHQRDDFLIYSALSALMRYALDSGDPESAAIIAGAVEAELERSEIVSQIGDERFRLETQKRIENTLPSSQYRRLLRQGRAIGPVAALHQGLRRLCSAQDVECS